MGHNENVVSACSGGLRKDSQGGKIFSGGGGGGGGGGAL